MPATLPQPSLPEQAPARRPWALPVVVFVICAAVYTSVAGSRVTGPSDNNHFVHLAHSWLQGQLHVVGDQPPGENDWACFDNQEHARCPESLRGHNPNPDRYKWYVSFPPFPAVLIAPVVALWGTHTLDALFWALLAGLGPALLFVLLRRLRIEGRSHRSQGEDLGLTALFAFGTVFFFVAVQGTVWFAAHVVAVPLVVLHLHFGLGARRPLLAGAMLTLAFVTRATTLFLVPFFLLEVYWACRPSTGRVITGFQWRAALRSLVLFSIPIAVVGVATMLHNQARFENPFEFGHSFLQIRWRPRIEKWGLFNYHYLPRNLAIFLAALPWLSIVPPHVSVGRHGLALWFTTPNLLWALYPRSATPPTHPTAATAVTAATDSTVRVLVSLYAGALVVAVLDLMYQNSGWIQFGYRFALDYLPLVFVALALSRRRWGRGFWVAAVFAVVVNTFGAVTFGRAPAFYDHSDSQAQIFQPH